MNDWKNILKADLESKILSEIEKEGGALGMKNLKQFGKESKIKQALSKLRKEGKIFMHEDGDIYTHKPEDIEKGKKKPFKGYNKKIHARTGGLSAKGRAKFKREQGSNLKPPVTTKPSKLKRGSKAAKRRKSFCARSRGFKRADGTYSEKARAARRRWNC